MYGPLHDLVGGAVARELTIGGRELTADEALAVHLVGEVVRSGGARRTRPGPIVARIVAAPRDVLMRTKAKALARAGYAHRHPYPRPLDRRPPITGSGDHQSMVIGRLGNHLMASFDAWTGQARLLERG